MWRLIIRSPSKAPIEYEIKPGKNSIGRKPDNHIVIADESASRQHAEIYCQDDLAVIHDLASTNGTFVNRERITSPHVLRTGDNVRIGQHVIYVAFQENGSPPNLITALSGTRPLTRELLLESIDQHAVYLDAISSRLTMILSLDSALQEIAELTKLALGADKAGVILADRFDGLTDSEFPISITRQAIELRSVVIAPDLCDHGQIQKTDDLHPLICSAVCVPVIIDPDVVALIYAYKTDPAARSFNQNDVQLTVAISHQAALTIQRAKLIKESQKLEELANTDSLTGLANRRQILHTAELEYHRTQRFNHTLTLLILDLDDLKQINDRHGHLVGDQALQLVADHGKGLIREADSIGRIGGDEFIVLLVETDLQEGRKVAERIHDRLNDVSIDTPEGSLGVTVSIGLATSNGGHSNFTGLLDQADKALREAKKNGKNQIVAAR